MLVEVDISKGLVVEIEINWGVQCFIQPFDYWGFPFLSLVCREVGHLKWDCCGTFTKDKKKGYERFCKNFNLVQSRSFSKKD
jgi:hypothetical protein